MKSIPVPLRNSVKLVALRRILFVIPLLLACLPVVPGAQAVSPPPDGGYPGGNTAEGTDALFRRTSGAWNTALGVQALYRDTTGGSNTATGFQALFSNSFGNGNTATGVQSLYSNLEGRLNTATGYRALYNNLSGENTANGYNALYSNTQGGGNTATGARALYHNNGGNFNTAAGVAALFNNFGGDYNVATGVQALFGNTSGSCNVAVGNTALSGNTTGNQNTAIGYGALGGDDVGNNNVAVGSNAGFFVCCDSNIDIGSIGFFGDSGTVRIGEQGTQTKTFIAGISGVAVTGDAVVVSSTGQLGVATSSVRFKDEIKPMDRTSEALLALKPVTFRYKKELDPDRRPQFGLVAEQVEKVNPDLVSHDADGKAFTVRYEAVNAMLLNEFLKEHRKVEEQQARITELRKELQANAARQQKQIEALAIGLQRVSAQLEMSRPVAKVAKSGQ
jgi:hypothetical protein